MVGIKKYLILVLTKGDGIVSRDSTIGLGMFYCYWF